MITLHEMAETGKEKMRTHILTLSIYLSDRAVSTLQMKWHFLKASTKIHDAIFMCLKMMLGCYKMEKRRNISSTQKVIWGGGSCLNQQNHFLDVFSHVHNFRHGVSFFRLKWNYELDCIWPVKGFHKLSRGSIISTGEESQDIKRVSPEYAVPSPSGWAGGLCLRTAEAVIFQ